MELFIILGMTFLLFAGYMYAEIETTKNRWRREDKEEEIKNRNNDYFE